MLIDSDKNKAKDYVDMQNDLINDNIEYRREWEEGCKKVALAYKGNKFPTTVVSKTTGNGDGKVGRNKNKPVFLNLIKRQYRVMSNFLRNNEPQYLITEASQEAEESDLVKTRQSLDTVFQGGPTDNEGFYDTIMDDTIHFGLHKAICWTMAYFDKKLGYKFKSYDPQDTYVDTDARRPSDIKKFLITYTRSREILKKEFPNDAMGTPINWDDEQLDKNQTDSSVKKCLLVEKPKSNTSLLREGLYLEGEGDDAKLWKIVTDRNHFLKKELIAGIRFMPVTAYSPMGDPDELYPRGWFEDMIPLEKKINELVAKLITITETGGRYVYIRAGTVLTKSTNNLMNSLGVEVIEVAENQELPAQATLLQISAADMQLLDFLMRQCEDEGGMKQDIMGSSSTGSDASGRAIQALQAGSKNNIGVALGELNKYMNRLTRIVLRLFSIYGTAGLYSQEAGQIDLKPDTYKLVNVKVSITGRDAFDEVTKQMNAIEILNMIQKFAPNTPLPPVFITKIMGVTNDIADDIQEELDKQTDPDLQIAEGENKKLIGGAAMNVNESDNHQLHQALHGASLKSLPPGSDAANKMVDHMRQHQAFDAAAQAQKTQ